MDGYRTNSYENPINWSFYCHHQDIYYGIADQVHLISLGIRIVQTDKQKRFAFKRLFVFLANLSATPSEPSCNNCRNCPWTVELASPSNSVLKCAYVCVWICVEAL